MNNLNEISERKLEKEGSQYEKKMEKHSEIMCIFCIGSYAYRRTDAGAGCRK